MGVSIQSNTVLSSDKQDQYRILTHLSGRFCVNLAQSYPEAVNEKPQDSGDLVATFEAVAVNCGANSSDARMLAVFELAVRNLSKVIAPSTLMKQLPPGLNTELAADHLESFGATSIARICRQAATPAVQ